ncbi:hypothetical protein, partial [Endozoicomonas sp. ALC066]|uniref:hypothetical protein n=1 Tax=Endozoicomonas sp. ALC066 TaxID=3403078 RepID=UPI003BB6AC46
MTHLYSPLNGWLPDSPPGLQLITAPLSLDELSRHRPLLDAAFQALGKTISTQSGPVKNRDLVWTFHERLANTEPVKKDNALGRLIFEKITYTVHRPTGSHTLMYQSPIKIGATPLTTLKWLGPGLYPGLQLVTPPLSLSHQTTNRDKLEATFYAVDKIISTQPQPLSDRLFHSKFDGYFRHRLPPYVDEPFDQTTIWQTKITGKADTGIILRFPSGNLDKPLAPVLFAVTDGPERERLLASLQAATRFVNTVIPASGNEAIHAQLRSLFTLLLFRLSSDDLPGQALFPGARLADYIHTYLSDDAVTTLSHHINRVGLQQVTDDLVTDLAQQAVGTPDPQAGDRIKDLLGTALDYRLANGTGLLPGTLPDTYSLPLADGGKYRELWTGLMSEYGTTRRVFKDADGHYLLDAALPLESSSMEQLYQSDKLTGPLKLALKPDSLGRDQEVTRTFLEMAMSRMDTDWPWFSRRFSSLPKLQRFTLVEALGQYGSNYPEADVRRLARALTKIQLGVINEQIIQGDNPETPAMFRIKSLESLSGENTLTTEDGSKVYFHAGSLLPVTHKKAPSPDLQQMLLRGSHSSQFPGSFLDRRHSGRLYRQALQDGQMAPDRFRDDVGRFIEILSHQGESHRREFHKQHRLDLSAGRPVHWRLNPHILLQASSLRVTGTAVIIELGMKKNPSLTLESFGTVVDRFYALSLAKSIEAVDAALFQSGWPKEAGQLAQLGNAIGFDAAQQWVSLPALNQAKNLYTLLADNNREAIERQFDPIGSPAGQKDFKQAMTWLFAWKPELLTLSFDRVSDYLQTHRDDPDIGTFARALYEFDRKLSNDNRDLFRGMLSHQQVEQLSDVLAYQAPEQRELISFINTLKTAVNSQAPATDAAGFAPSTYRLVRSESGLKVVVIKDPDASDQKRCRRGVGGCGTRLLLTGNLADHPLLGIDSTDISDTDTGKPYYKVEFLTYQGKLHRVLSRSGNDITATPLDDEVSLHDSIHNSGGSPDERVISDGTLTTTSVAVKRSGGEVYQLISEDGDHYRAIRLQT